MSEKEKEIHRLAESVLSKLELTRLELERSGKPRNLISFKTAMERLCCRRDKVYDLIREGKIIAYKHGVRTLIDADSLAEYQASFPRLELRSK